MELWPNEVGVDRGRRWWCRTLPPSHRLCVVAVIRHEEVVAREREALREVQPRDGAEVGVRGAARKNYL
jgi:hypothetical protein